MNTFKVLFPKSSELNLLDRKTFALKHSLSKHESLSLNNLATLIKGHPKDKLLFSDELNKLDKNFDYALENENQINFEEAIEKIKNSNAYIAIKNPELNPTFQEIFEDIKHDLSLMLKLQNKDDEIIEPMLWIFIASPNAITPFHIDRFSNFIMQIRGTKELAVYPPRDYEIVSKQVTEAYIDWSGSSPLWKEETDHLATKYSFQPGEAAHIPFTSGHYVKNGSDDISITISVFFHTKETQRWTKAMKLNNRLKRFKLKTRSVDQSKSIDSLKEKIFNFENRIENSFRKIIR